MFHICCLDLPGISKIEVNFTNEKATLEYDESKIRLNTIEKAIEEVGYKVVYDYLIRFQRLESPNSKYR